MIKISKKVKPGSLVFRRGNMWCLYSGKRGQVLAGAYQASRTIQSKGVGLNDERIDVTHEIPAMIATYGDVLIKFT